MSSTERNKVKSFGDPSVDHGQTAEPNLGSGGIKGPPPVSNRVKLEIGILPSLSLVPDLLNSSPKSKMTLPNNLK